MYTFTDKRSDYLNCPQKVREQFAVYGVLGRGTFGEVRLAFEKVSFMKLNVNILLARYNYRYYYVYRTNIRECS